jgi:hypothetical protein
VFAPTTASIAIETANTLRSIRHRVHRIRERTLAGWTTGRSECRVIQPGQRLGSSDRSRRTRTIGSASSPGADEIAVHTASNPTSRRDTR